ncbi:hypothetical protein [Brevibacillus nitrificans]|uniref:hypothetical protein n=1 Tax=Brevibacillus nitrificans TaxID=651560 RepID=UPI002618ED82|nr:hypothetical protein [Brevibacillus nitrificans]
MSLFQFLFSRHKSLIYTALGSQDYFRVSNKLQEAPGTGVDNQATNRAAIIIQRVG